MANPKNFALPQFGSPLETKTGRPHKEEANVAAQLDNFGPAPADGSGDPNDHIYAVDMKKTLMNNQPPATTSSSSAIIEKHGAGRAQPDDNTNANKRTHLPKSRALVMRAMVRGRPSSGDNRPNVPDSNTSNTRNESTKTKGKEREDSTTEATDSCFLYNTPVDNPAGQGLRVFNIVKVVERPEFGLKYANLGDGLWYPLNEDNTLREMTTPEFKEFVDWRIASLLSSDTNDWGPIVETEEHNLEASMNDGLDHSEFDNYSAIEDRQEEDFQWVIDAMNDDDLQYFSMDDFEEIYSPGERAANNHAESNSLEPPTTPTHSSPRRARPPKTPKWTDHSRADENGLLDTQLRRRQEKGRRLRKKCAWLRVPALPVYSDSGVPDLIMTSPKGGTYSLHDPLDYE